MNITKIDAIELLQSLDDKSVDLILTDPPYYKLLKVDWDNQWKTKDDYLKALRSYQAHLDEIKSVQRDEAAAFKDEWKYY